MLSLGDAKDEDMVSRFRRVYQMPTISTQPLPRQEGH